MFRMPEIKQYESPDIRAHNDIEMGWVMPRGDSDVKCLIPSYVKQAWQDGLRGALGGI